MAPELKALCVIASFLIVIAVAVWAININNFINDKKAEDSLAKVVRNDNYDINYEIYKLENEINASKKALNKDIDADIKQIISQNLKKILLNCTSLKQEKKLWKKKLKVQANLQLQLLNSNYASKSKNYSRSDQFNWSLFCYKV